MDFSSSSSSPLFAIDGGIVVSPEQLAALKQLEDRLRLVEAAANLLEVDTQEKPKTQQSQRSLSTRAKVVSLGVDLPKVSQLKKRFESSNHRSVRVLATVSRALRMGGKDSRPPPRPMTLARTGVTREAGSGGS